jgi:hypothetical protein
MLTVIDIYKGNWRTYCMKNIMIMLVINLMSLGIIPMVLAQEQMGDFTLGIVEDPIRRGH